MGVVGDLREGREDPCFRETWQIKKLNYFSRRYWQVEINMVKSARKSGQPSRANRDWCLALSNKVAYTSEIRTQVLLPMRLCWCCFCLSCQVLWCFFQSCQQSRVIKLSCLVFWPFRLFFRFSCVLLYKAKWVLSSNCESFFKKVFSYFSWHAQIFVI